MKPADSIGVSQTPDSVPSVAAARAVVPRWLAMIEAFAVCGIPTQLVVAAILVLALGLEPFGGGTLSFSFFAMLSLVDTALVALLILLFLTLSGETSREVFVGPRSVAREMVRGLLLVPVVAIAVTLFVLALRAVAPALHNVSDNPFEAFMGSPFEAAIFIVIVVLAGGVREELARAFILHRFRQALGGVVVGLVVFSITFGLLHLDQGYDIALAVGLLGLFWGILYVTRRSAVLGMTNHAGFNAAQVLQVLLARMLGG